MARATKKLVNSPDACVDEMLRGMVAALPGLDLHADSRVLLRRQEACKPKGKVALLSGGGSGHEPFCGGYVGRGMLGAAVAGSVFASPPSSHVLYGIRCLVQQGARGVLVVVPNYTGDCLNFGLAVERARALGLRIEEVKVAEDCALLGEDGKEHGVAGRRGLCGHLFVYKLAGCLADAGASLEAVAERARKVASSMATIGVCLQPCSLPGAGPLFTLGAEELELGLGVHGEQGAMRMKFSSAHEITKTMVARLEAALKLKSGDRVAALLNNLGGTSQLEQALMAGELHAALASRGVRVERLLMGHLMTSLEMSGVQFSVLRLPSGAEGDQWLADLDAPTDAAAWPGGPLSVPCSDPPTPAPQTLLTLQQTMGPELTSAVAEQVVRGLHAAGRAARDSEERLNQLDSGCGDGDCGSTLKRLADGALSLGVAEATRPARLLQALSLEAETRMGGTSGAVYSLLLEGAAVSLSTARVADPDAWARAWRAALTDLQRHTPARPGDRTLLDALEPACAAFEEAPKGNWAEAVKALDAAAAAADRGCQATRRMTPRVGRASYVDQQRVQDVDAGAAGVVVWLRALAQQLRRE